VAGGQFRVNHVDWCTRHKLLVYPRLRPYRCVSRTVHTANRRSFHRVSEPGVRHRNCRLRLRGASPLGPAPRTRFAVARKPPNVYGTGGFSV
jgi:hypothetical protein